MNRGLSLYLDVLRFGAAVVVLVTHLAYAELSGGMIAYWRYVGNDAVMVFFVLSGFVIAHVANTRERTLGEYTTSRLARLWSVAVPALIITLLLDSWGARLDPAYYSQWWNDNADPLWRSMRALTFSGQLWFDNVRIFSNGPWWSLGYEAVYYAIFAALFYFTGARKWLVAGALMVIAGPKVLLLFPIWWLGVWTWKRAQRAPLPADKAAIAFFGSIAIYAIYRWSVLPLFFKAATYHYLGVSETAHYLGFGDEFISSYVIGPLVALHILGAHGLGAHLGRFLERWQGPIRWTAQSTFALYLLHYPMLRFADAAFAHDETNAWQVAALGIGVTGACVLVGPAIERTKGTWKKVLAPLFIRPPKASAQPA